MSLEIKGLYKDFDEISLYRDFCIDFPEGTITCILGPSGCGKTTLLNIIGNIIKPDRGTLIGFGIPGCSPGKPLRVISNLL
jgi:NitT/TauT family transport system ATP-binding protein